MRSLKKRVMGIVCICVMRLSIADHVCTGGPGSISWLPGPWSQARSPLTAPRGTPRMSAFACRHVGARRTAAPGRSGRQVGFGQLGRQQQVSPGRFGISSSPNIAVSCEGGLTESMVRSQAPLYLSWVWLG